MSECPYCGAAAGDAEQEILHMHLAHPDVLARRLLVAYGIDGLPRAEQRARFGVLQRMGALSLTERQLLAEHLAPEREGLSS